MPHFSAMTPPETAEIRPIEAVHNAYRVKYLLFYDEYAMSMKAG